MNKSYQKNNNEKKTEKITFLTTPTGRQKIEEAAKKFNMSISSYVESKVLKPQKFNSYLKSNMYVTLVEVSAAIDEAINQCEKGRPSFFTDTEVLSFLEKCKKGVDKLWH